MRESVRFPVGSGVARGGAAVYAAACANCHGQDRRGRDRAPSLVGIDRRLSAEQIAQVVNNGRGFMPSFTDLPSDTKHAVIEYLLGRRVDSLRLATAQDTVARSPYEFAGYERWRDSAGLPVIKPPWGTLTAIDLNTGNFRWRIPLGRHPALPNGGAVSGTEQYGGPIVTAGGLVFIAATQDAKFRAFDKDTGKLLWETALPAAGYATPSTYAAGGKQYVVIAAGGGKLGTSSGDAYVAYALP
jgi:quinoprotein glucose dehydrogenase